MIRPYPSSYDSVGVVRRLKGGQRLLTQLTEEGRQNLGDDPATAASVSFYGISRLKQWGESDELQEPRYYSRPVADPLLKVTTPDELAMVVSYRGLRRDQSARIGLAETVRRLQAANTVGYRDVTSKDGETHRAKMKLPGLRQQLDEISISHGLNPQDTLVSCDRIRIIDQPGEGQIIGLIPDTSTSVYQVLVEQKDAVEEHLRSSRATRRTAERVPPMTDIAALIARCPGNTPAPRLRHLMDDMEQYVPVVLHMGPPVIRSQI